MPPRVDGSKVKEILDTGLDAGELGPFINTAHRIVEDRLVVLGELSEETLTEIEIWLSAHLATTRDPRVTREAAHEAYYQVSGLALRETMYGRTAMALDTTGSLSDLGKEGGYVFRYDVGYR